MKLVVCTLTFSTPFYLLEKEGETEESITKAFGEEFKTLAEEVPDGMRADMECEIVESETEGAIEERTHTPRATGYLFGTPETVFTLPAGFSLRVKQDCWMIAQRGSDASEWLVWQDGARIELRRWKKIGNGKNYVDERDKIVIAE